MYACALTGHRKLGQTFDRAAVKDVLKRLIEKENFSVFYCGMALGFDTVCFQLLQELKAEGYALRVVACIPFEGQADRFSSENREIYEKMLEQCDRKYVLSPAYTKYCMFVRNRFMVDRSDAVLAYLRFRPSGTAYTVDYAEKKGKPVYKL